jgi:hypothetical protein
VSENVVVTGNSEGQDTSLSRMDILKCIRSGDINASISSSENIVATCNRAFVCVHVYAYEKQALMAERGPHGGAQLSTGASTGAHSRALLSPLRGTNETIPDPPREKKLAHPASSVESLSRSIHPFLQRSVPLHQSISHAWSIPHWAGEHAVVMDPSDPSAQTVSIRVDPSRSESIRVNPRRSESIRVDQVRCRPCPLRSLSGQQS